jgi:hypothetical protein
MQGMNDEVRQALLHLTALRKRVLKASDMTGQLFAPLIGKAEPQPTHSDLERAVKDLEQKVPDYYIWYEPRHARYALIPKTDQELDVTQSVARES